MTDTANDSPIFSIQKLYIKDSSFENPNAPEVFTISDPKPNVELNIAVENKQIDTEHWEVALKISVIMRDQKNDKLLFEIEIEQAGIFYMKNISDEQMAIVLGVDCPTIIFPYTRQLISQMTVDGGFMPLLLEPVNFSGAFEAQQTPQQLN
ncbi:MAG: protein-export chaperone SecB [Mariprofundus sp.]|nr:protein-export chaperone SecB [Mariprofundus sp.]